jgi:hypothetical protein
MIRMMRRLLLGVALLAACGSEGKPGDDLVRDLADLMNEMCACKDRTCADAVVAKKQKVEERARAVYKEIQNLPKENINKIVLLNTQLERCHEQAAPREGEPTIDPSPGEPPPPPSPPVGPT